MEKVSYYWLDFRCQGWIFLLGLRGKAIWYPCGYFQRFCGNFRFNVYKKTQLTYFSNVRERLSCERKIIMLAARYSTFTLCGLWFHCQRKVEPKSKFFRLFFRKRFSMAANTQRLADDEVSSWKLWRLKMRRLHEEVSLVSTGSSWRKLISEMSRF